MVQKPSVFDPLKFYCICDSHTYVTLCQHAINSCAHIACIHVGKYVYRLLRKESIITHGNKAMVLYSHLNKQKTFIYVKHIKYIIYKWDGIKTGCQQWLSHTISISK